MPRRARASEASHEDASAVEQRRRMVVDILRQEVITSATDLAKALEAATGRPAPATPTLNQDLQAIGVVRVNLGGGVWRYRTADLLNIDDARLGLKDRLASDGLSANYFSDGIVILTTKGTAGATATLLKMMKDYDLDRNVHWVIHDHDDTVLVGISPKEARAAYLATFRDWMKGRL
jgi:arginine repressor